jgi:hypothetical protein
LSLLNYLEVECEDTSRKRGDSVLRRADRSLVEKQKDEDVMMDLTLYPPRPKIHDLNGNSALQSDNSVRYLCTNFLNSIVGYSKTHL